FLIYSPSAFVYRLMLTFGIAIFVAQQYFIVGVLIAIWAIVQALALPIAKGIRYVFTSTKLRRNRDRAMIVTFGTLAAILLLLLVIPLPSRTLSEGVIWLPEASYVRAGTPGFIRQLLVKPGAAVHARDDLVALEEPALDARIRSLAGRVRELDIKLGQN